MSAEEIPAVVRTCVAVAREKSALDVVVLDLREVVSFTDFFIVMTGNSSRQAQAIVDGLRERLKAEGVKPLHLEGYAQAEWILLDLSDVVVHVFSPVKREYYDLERLWSDARRVELPDVAA